MPLKEEQIKAIEMLAAHEEAIGSLYKTYAERLVECRDFWLRLSFEEVEHAMWIRDFENKAKEGKTYFDKNRFKVQAIKLSLDYVNEKIEDAASKRLLPTNALSIALDLENALLDSSWFDYFATDSAELRNLVFALRQATKKHRDKIRMMWKRRKERRHG